MKSTSGKVQKVSDMKCPQVSKVQVKLKLIKLYIFTCIYILNTSGQLIVCLFQIFSVFF